MTIDSITATAPRPDRGSVGVESAAAPAAGRNPAAAVETVDAVKAKEAAPSKKDVEEAVAKLNKSVQDRAQALEFSIDNDSNRTIVKVIDQSTKEVLRQIPTPEALQIAKSIDARSGGLLVDQEA
ncbi:flagellar biosynthesis protein FlaG [Pseudoduganella sp. DS3]|uniref:Flagellar biosynthesis protein FlaG n=1 Tax=Pseudoduganella guangdongensis TaxID=2692179 RepID=A0A6N9HE93_9BURK|nr:flagellar protein FlaG [Pseudoduganella guangdongensis]MYN01888.1 flagellar biosynthesis protein FlaG [Pseudoduganella guangdongensis]